MQFPIFKKKEKKEKKRIETTKLKRVQGIG